MRASTSPVRIETPLLAAVAGLLIAGAGPVGATSRERERTEPVDRVVDVLDALAEDLSAREDDTGIPGALSAGDMLPRDAAKEALGRLLFHDKLLSGNRNISCASCHHPLTDTGDGLSLSIGEGGRGLGIARSTGSGRDRIVERVPRNAPHTFMLGALEFTRMFHDGRVEIDPSRPSGFRSPAGDDLPLGLENVVAVQAMFPVTSMTEMAGQAGENAIADAAVAGDLAGPEGVSARLAGRIRRTPGYPKLFAEAFPSVRSASDITFVHAANAIAAFETGAFTLAGSPFDRFLAGDRRALSRNAQAGMRLFYGRAGCSSCHRGVLQTDHAFHAIAMPQIGPGKGDNSSGYTDGHEDFGRERVTGDPGDRYRFRTPTLRNVALTGPWGHDGAYDTLEAVVRHHLDPVGSLMAYDTAQAVLPPRADLEALDFVVQNDGVRRGRIADACELEGMNLSDDDLARLLDFLHALTDPRAVDLRHEAPMTVPSGLPVFD